MRNPQELVLIGPLHSTFSLAVSFIVSSKCDASKPSFGPGLSSSLKEPTALALHLFIEEAILTLNVFAKLGLSYGDDRDRYILGR
jgi:hypothetical protein